MYRSLCGHWGRFRGARKISLSPRFDPLTVLLVAAVFLKTGVFGVTQCRKLLWHCLTLPIPRYGCCYSPHDTALQCTRLAAQQHHRETLRPSLVSSIHFGRFGTSALGWGGYVEIELQLHPIGDVMRASGFKHSLVTLFFLLLGSQIKISLIVDYLAGGGNSLLRNVDSSYQLTRCLLNNRVNLIAQAHAGRFYTALSFLCLIMCISRAVISCFKSALICGIYFD